MNNIQVLLLAAGASSRMGQPKQLLPWGNETLIENQIKKLTATDCPVSVVLGAHLTLITSQIKSYPVSIVNNTSWKLGMGNSIAFGLKNCLAGDKKIDGVLITLVDQPLLTTAHFNTLLQGFQAGKKQILVSKSKEGWSGSPVLFDQFYFNELLNLKGDEGAKIITEKYSNAIHFVEGGNLLKDMDTKTSYLELLKHYKG